MPDAANIFPGQHLDVGLAGATKAEVSGIQAEADVVGIGRIEQSHGFVYRLDDSGHMGVITKLHSLIACVLAGLVEQRS